MSQTQTILHPGHGNPSVSDTHRAELDAALAGMPFEKVDLTTSSGAEFAQQKTAFERRRKPISLAFAGVLVGLLLTSGSRWSAIGASESAIFLLGLTLAGVGCLGRLWCSLYIAGYKTRVLVTAGPYSLCRNPLYFFSCVGGTGVLLASGTFALPAIMLVAFAVFYPWIIRQEESRLLAVHQDEFLTYCRKTPCFFPKWSQLQEPKDYTVHPRVFRTGILDAFWFLFLTGTVHFLADLHRTGALPTLWRLW